MEAKTDELESGEEYCPICQRRNSPGAGETCEHYLGAIWEGELIWGKFENGEGEQFADAVEAIRELRGEVDEDDVKVRKKLAALCKKRRFNFDLFTSGTRDDEIFKCMATSIKSNRVVTDGPLSGEGSSIYDKDPHLITKLTAKLKTLHERLKEVIEPPGASG